MASTPTTGFISPSRRARRTPASRPIYSSDSSDDGADLWSRSVAKMLRGKASASRFVRDADAAPPRTRLKLRYEDDDAETETEDHLEEEEDVDEDAT